MFWGGEEARARQAGPGLQSGFPALETNSRRQRFAHAPLVNSTVNVSAMTLLPWNQYEA